MKVVVQRVKEASVHVDDQSIGSISHGYLLYVCFEKDDNSTVLKKAVHKIVELRIFEDQDDKMNLNILQAKGEILSISQFTLSWNGLKGHRPSFDQSMHPNSARLMYHEFNESLRKAGLKVEEGKFAANMQIHSVNNGPVTFHFSFEN